MAVAQISPSLKKENWRLAYAQRRLVILQSALDGLLELVSEPCKLKARLTCEDILLCADALDAIEVMPGPTGETNELYVVGRGDVAVLGLPLAPEMEAGGPVAFIAQTLCALITGNSVKLVAMAEWCAELIENIQAELVKVGVPAPVVSLSEFPALHATAHDRNTDVGSSAHATHDDAKQMMAWLFNPKTHQHATASREVARSNDHASKTRSSKSSNSGSKPASDLVLTSGSLVGSHKPVDMTEVALLAPVGDRQAMALLAVQAAEFGLDNQSAILQLAPAQDLEGFSDVVTPDHVYRFVTERVRTINTTAIGGNASLIEASAG